jgi:protein TonB
MSAILLPNGGLSSGAASPALADAAGARRGAGLAVVIAVHALIGWALASGLARDVIAVIQKPIETVIIPEVAPPPPPPPPKVEKIKEIPRIERPPPPPAYVPPPEVVPVVTPPAPVIVAVQAEPPKEPVVIAPPPPPAPVEPKVVKQEISLACPGYQNVLEQMLADAFDRVGVVGAVRTRITVRGSQVVDAVPQSGPKEYYKYVQTAIKRMKCSAGGAEEVQVVLDVLFRR